MQMIRLDRAIFVLSVVLFLNGYAYGAQDRGRVFAINNYMFYSLNVEVDLYDQGNSVTKFETVPAQSKKVILSPEEFKMISRVRMEPKALTGGFAHYLSESYHPSFGMPSDVVRKADFTKHNVHAYIDERKPRKSAVVFEEVPIE